MKQYDPPKPAYPVNAAKRMFKCASGLGERTNVWTIVQLNAWNVVGNKVKSCLQKKMFLNSDDVNSQRGTDVLSMENSSPSSNQSEVRQKRRQLLIKLRQQRSCPAHILSEKAENNNEIEDDFGDLELLRKRYVMDREEGEVEKPGRTFHSFRSSDFMYVAYLIT